MNTLHKRYILFLLMCIPSRYLISYGLFKMPKRYLRYISALLIIPVIGWIYIYLTDSRKTGAETFGNRIWWNSLRPLHAILYMFAAILAFRKNNDSWKLIALDTTIGLLSFICYHFF